MDPLSMVEDEVALEGLDGITIPTLWIRLEDRKPKFPLNLDDGTKELIWRSLISNTNMRFYQLPQEREDVVLFDRFKENDSEGATETSHRSSDYLVEIVPENKDGIQGSCAMFKQRRDVTKDVRSKSLTPLVCLDEAFKRYGRKLVVVASQTLRFRTLIGPESDPDMKLSDDSYCVLELVGRARWQGELQRDLHGSSFKIDARKFHYMRKSLVRHGLVSMQPHVTRLKSGQQQHSILLLLKRFHVNRRTKYDVLMDFVSNYLQQSPGQLATLMALRAQLNVNESSFKRVFQYMRAAKLVEFCRCPLEDLEPSGGPCLTKKGNKVMVRCLRLLKPYTGRGVPDDDDDEDEDDEEETGARLRSFPPLGRTMERDMLTHAYHLILSCGTKGVAQSGIEARMNVGKLESRMLCRKLERDGAVKGFMEDEGRQRTTKFISHKFVGVSNQLQLVAKEQERKKLLYSSTPQTSGSKSASLKTPSTSKSTVKESPRTPAAKKIRKAVERGGDKDEEEAEEAGSDRGEDVGDEGLDGVRAKARGKSGAGRKTTGRKRGATSKQTEAETSIIQPAPSECETPACSSSLTDITPETVSVPTSEQASVKEEKGSDSQPASPLPQSAESDMAKNTVDNNIMVVEGIDHQGSRRNNRPIERNHETYRLLKRKNLIVEAVRNLKIIEGLFPLQKMINEEEKQDGVSSKCCKKTILRLVHCLSREGLLKIYRTTVIQDGITKKLEMVVHPSIQPNDSIVTQVIEQVRFRISSSYAAVRMQTAEIKAREEENKSEEKPKKEDDEFKPTTVRGLGKTLGFQPKMHRLRVIHNFLWYVIYGHPLLDRSATSQSSENAAGSSVDPQTADSTMSNVEAGDENEDLKDKSTSQSDMKVYVDEDSWKRFVPPVRTHKEYDRGWAMVGDLLLCLPLSIFIQVIQINYKVEGLEEYLNDPVKQHYLVRKLPAKMRRELLYKRKYIFTYMENMQRMVYMGLVQFGPVERFKEKDQVFVYLRRNATIVDTTSAEPHYWLVMEPPDKSFERRQYTFSTAEDVENYWFDLMCVCLNTPLGVIRSKRNVTEEDATPSFVHERNVFVGLSYLLKGSREVCDDGSIPGDSKGAGGLDSNFFAHLKRNWLWTNHLLAVKTKPSGSESKESKIRLKSLLTKNALRIALKAGGSTNPRYVTPKRPLVRPENIELAIEPASRNQQVVGGKRQKRKRTKKEVIKPPRKKKKEPTKRTPAHDEADHQALKMMTRQRVYWAVQEDSLMMLCSVASRLLNSKLKRPFIPYCVVRDLLHAEFEISMDKTSLAVGRRTRYILKNPQTLLNYRICLAEVYQDKSLLKLLEENKPTNPDKPEDCVKAFSEYTKLLRQKFSSVMSSSEINVSDTKQQLFSRYKVCAIEHRKQLPNKDTLNCTEDIHSIVLHNVIQSTLAMTNSQMKSSRSFQTFHMYSKYNQELLCQVFIQCRKRGLVNRRRVNQPFGPKKNRALPILPMSYQLSQTYYRCFSWRFPHMLCTDSFRFLRTLLDNRTENDRPATAFYHETENRNVDGTVVTEKRSQSERKDSRPTIAPEVKPDKSGSNSTNIGDDNQSTAEADMELESKNDETGLPTGSAEDSSTREQPDNQPAEENQQRVTRGLEEVSDVSDMMPFSMDSPGGACAVSLSLMSLGLLSMYLSIPKQLLVVDSNMVDNDVVKSMAALEEEDDDDEDGEECEVKKRLEVKAHQASHTNYLMMRGYCCPGIVKQRNLNTSDNIVVESCLIKVQLRNTPAHHMFTEGENYPPLDLSKCGPSLLPPILSNSVYTSSTFPPSEEECDQCLVQQKGYLPQDIHACAQLRRSLDEAGEKGLDVHDLSQVHAHLEEPESGCSRSLQEYMKDLKEEGQVLRVGSLGARWVLMRHADPWLLTVNSKQWSQSRLPPGKLPFIENQHNIPFMRKRCTREVRQEEPPAKRPATDRQEGEKGEEGEEESSCNTREKLDEQKGGVDLESEDKLMLEEKEEKQAQPEEEQVEEAGQEQMNVVEKQERRMSQRIRRNSVDEGDEAGSPPTGQADLNEEENLSFISRPWRMVDGKLNRQVCKGMLEAVLYHVMSRPGLTQQELVEHYKDVLQPMAVMDLVQALVDMGCVTKKTLVKAPKPTLFSRVTPSTTSGTEVKIEESDAVFYEPTISCCLRLGQVLPNERHWNYCIL